MANIFGILTTVILLLSLFVASKNKTRYEDEIVRVIAEKDRLTVSQERLATAQKKLADLEEAIPLAQARTAELIAQVEEQRAANTRQETQLQTKTSEVSRNRDRIAELQQQLDSSGNLEELVQRLRALQTEITALKTGDDGLPARIANLDRMAAQAAEIAANTATAAAVLDGYARGESRPGLTTRIRSIYPNWGFVTLAAGGVSGLAGNSTLDVIRNDQMIAKLQVTAVEANSATATIVPGSLADDVTLAVGDTVIPGTRIETN